MEGMTTAAELEERGAKGRKSLRGHGKTCFSKSPLGAHRVCGDAAKAHGSVDSPHPEELSGNDVVTVTAPNGSSSLYAGKTPVSG